MIRSRAGLMEGGTPDRLDPTGTQSSAWAQSWYYTVQDDGTVGGWGNWTHRPLGCKQDKRLGGIPMIPNVAFLGEGEGYLRGVPILLQEWPEGDSQREEQMSRAYHRLLKLATSSVQLGAMNGQAQGY